MKPFDAVVLSGGGMKGIATIGALVEFKEAGWLRGVTCFAGTSVGAALATMLAINADLQKVYTDHVLNFTYDSTYDLTGLDKTFGIDTGEGLQEWINRLLGEQHVNMTFRDVLETYGSMLLICATNLNTKQPVTFGPETHPHMKVAQALRMSCSIPLYFAATSYEGELYVDGAITDNFPLGPAAEGGGCRRLLGIRITGQPKPPHTPWTLDTFVSGLVDCAVRRPFPQDVEAVVIDIDAGTGTQPMDFRMPPAHVRHTFQSGQQQAREFMYMRAKKVK